jgi:hypothetical protein
LADGARNINSPGAETLTSAPTPQDQPARPTLREIVGNALKYWELWRLVYNAALAVVVVWYFVAGFPGSMHLVELNALLVLFFLAVVANVLYSVAYLVDVFVQLSVLRPLWLRWRWGSS